MALRWQVSRSHPTPCTRKPTPYTQKPTSYTLKPTPYPPKPTPYTLKPTPYTLKPTPYTLKPTPYTLHPKAYTLHPKAYTLKPTPYTLKPTPYTLRRVRGGTQVALRWQVSRFRHSPSGAQSLIKNCHLIEKSPSIHHKAVTRLLRHRIAIRRPEEIGISLPNNQRQHRTLHIQKNVLPYALCQPGQVVRFPGWCGV